MVVVDAVLGRGINGGGSSAIHINIEPQEGEKNRSIEHGIDDPSSDAITASSQEMQGKNPNMTNQIRTQEQHAAVEREEEAVGGQPDLGPESVGVDQGVNHGGDQNGGNLKGLGELEPEEGGEEEDGVVEEAEEG